jgi:small multidrug resistance pump
MINSYNGYIYLLLSIISSCICNVFIKLSDGFTKIVPSSVALIFTIILTILLGITYTKMELNISYPIYASSVILFTCIFGIVVYKEKMTKYTILGTILIILGIIALFKK